MRDAAQVHSSAASAECHRLISAATPLAVVQAAELVLHWGVRMGQQEWVIAPQRIWPSGSVKAGSIAAETGFQPNGETVRLGGRELKIHAVGLSIPPDAGLKGLTFVLRSADNSAWFRDGEPSI